MGQIFGPRRRQRENAMKAHMHFSQPPMSLRFPDVAHRAPAGLSCCRSAVNFGWTTTPEAVSDVRRFASVISYLRRGVALICAGGKRRAAGV